jgi:hypothetical protein
MYLYIFTVPAVVLTLSEYSFCFLGDRLLPSKINGLDSSRLDSAGTSFARIAGHVDCSPLEVNASVTYSVHLAVESATIGG